MKKVMLLLSIFFFSFSLFAQLKDWRITKIGVTGGWEQDMPFSLSSQSMIQSARGGDNSDIAKTSFKDSDVMDMFCENLHHRLEVSLEGPNMENSEIRVGLSGVFNRGESITYNIEDSNYGYLNMDSWTNEIALETSFMKYFTPRRWFRWYAGGGLNVGTSFGFLDVYYSKKNADSNSGVIHEEIGTNIPQSDNYYYSYYESYNLKTGLHNRLFAQAGFAFRIRRVELGPEIRYGLGYRKFNNVDTQWTQLRSYAFAVRVALGEYDWTKREKRILARHYF